MSLSEEITEMLLESGEMLKSIDDLKFQPKPKILNHLDNASYDYYSSMNKVMNCQKTLMHESDALKLNQKKYTDIVKKSNDHFSKILVSLMGEVNPKLNHKKSKFNFGFIFLYIALFFCGLLIGMFYLGYKKNPTKQVYYNKCTSLKDDIY